jgi:hypothetical protein
MHIYTDSVLAYSILVVGCGGHTANPVDRYMPGDENKSCNALYAEMAQLDNEVAQKKNDKDNRDTWNVILFVAGFFTIVTFFFMDVKGSHEVEIDALQARNKALQNIFHEKNCSPPEATTPVTE